MLFLEGLIGMAAISTAAMWGFEELGVNDPQEDAASGDRSRDKLEPSAEAQPSSLLDLAGNDDHEGDDYGIIRGRPGGDGVSASSGNEILDGLDGDDSLSSGGGEGADTQSGGVDDDALHGYLGDDTLDGEARADSLFGGAGNDVLCGIAPQSVTSEQDQDYLYGGSSDDTIALGAGATGGNGPDSFILRDWLNAQHQGRIIDFNTDEDNLVLLYDDTGHIAPDVSIEQDGDIGNLQRILLDGEVIAEIFSDTPVTLAHITLIPQNAA